MACVPAGIDGSLGGGGCLRRPGGATGWPGALEGFGQRLAGEETFRPLRSLPSHPA